MTLATLYELTTASGHISFQSIFILAAMAVLSLVASTLQEDTQEMTKLYILYIDSLAVSLYSEFILNFLLKI